MSKKIDKKKTKMVFYTNKKTKNELESLKFEIWNATGKNVSLAELFREAISDLLKNHRLETVNRYLVNSNDSD
jgi:hypothetical protein